MIAWAAKIEERKLDESEEIESRGGMIDREDVKQ